MRSHTIAPIAMLIALTELGCGQTQWKAAQWNSAGGSPTQTLRTADQTMDVELTDRVDRLRRLAAVQGVAPPQIEEVTLSADRIAGALRSIPVIRVTFSEHDFFAAGSAAPLPGAAQVLRIMAENMHRDVPDVRVTVLGHTDASGADGENMALSQSRALGVVQALATAGVTPGQLGALSRSRRMTR